MPGNNFNWILLVAFILIAASDGVDGAIARKQNTVTTLNSARFSIQLLTRFCLVAHSLFYQFWV